MSGRGLAGLDGDLDGAARPNALLSGELAAAERFIASAHDVAAAMTPSGHAALNRATAELHLAAGRWDEAERWSARARAIGEELAMGHQIRLAEQMLGQLERRGRSP